MILIVDASVALAWHFEDESTAIIDAFRAECEDATLYVPAHWLAEVANGVLVGERRKRSNDAQATRFVTWLGLLATVVDTEGAMTATQSLLPLARQYGLTIYDAAYLELAMRRNLPLATLDAALATAARAAGVTVVDVA